MKLYLLVLIGGILLISAISVELSSALDSFAMNEYQFVSSSATINSNNKNDDIEQLNRLQICCSWSAKLSDGVLKYSIDTMEEESRDAIANAIEEWNSKLDGLQLTEEKGDPAAADIRIVLGELADGQTGNRYYEFRNRIDKDLTLVPSAGWTQFTFSKEGFIEGTKIIISKDVIRQDFDKKIIEQIAKHELGHALGLGHANFEESLMADLIIEGRTPTISECEINGIYTANSWKFVDSKQNPEHIQRPFISC
jgi:predicted Zn-dependent protease